MKRIALTAIILACAAMIVAFFPTLLRTDDENKARSIAKNEAYKRGWSFVLVKSVVNQSNQWIINIESFPFEYGGHATVEIVDGKVTKYKPGK